MAEPTLSLDYSALLEEVSWFLGYGRNTANLTPDQTAECDEIVQSGYRMFLSPPLAFLAGIRGLAGRTHIWSFLSPQDTLALKAGTVDYDAPDDFGGLVGPMTLSTSGLNTPVDQRSEGFIMTLRSQQSISGRPQYVAVRPKAHVAATSTVRFEFLIWPTPDAARTLYFRYNVRQDKLDATNKYPLGGAEHAQAIKAACLAMAEAARDEERGPNWELFGLLIATSVSQDIQNISPDRLGYCADASAGTGWPVPARVPYVTYKGQRFNT